MSVCCRSNNSVIAESGVWDVVSGCTKHMELVERTGMPNRSQEICQTSVNLHTKQIASWQFLNVSIIGLVVPVWYENGSQIGVISIQSRDRLFQRRNGLAISTVCRLQSGRVTLR